MFSHDSICFWSMNGEEDDLQLAAELGKTLLDRNQELENSLRHQNLIIEEQSREIELLTKQVGALREVNDSRLKIYEQLESSITDLERTNQRLRKESLEDKKRIKSLSNNVEALEMKCEELQQLGDDWKKASERQSKRARAETLTVIPETGLKENLRRVLSLDSGFHDDEFSRNQDIYTDQEVISLRASLSKLKCQLAKEQEEKFDLEAEISVLIQENAHLQYELQVVQEEKQSSLDVELQTGINKRKDSCPDCEFAMSSTSNCDNEEVLDCDVEAEEVTEIGECSLVQLRNGVLAYGSQESLLSITNALESKLHSSNIHKGVSLLSELDDQYRELIEKYEDMLSSRRLHHGKQKSQSSGVEDCKGAKRNNNEFNEDVDKGCDSTNNETDVKQTRNHLTATLQWSSTLPELSRSKLATEELSDSSLSSGFSEISDRIMVDQEIQTESFSEAKTEQMSSTKTLDVSSSSPDSLNDQFSCSPPEYKRLFKEIFEVLKQSLSVDHEENIQLPQNFSPQKSVISLGEQTSKSSLSPNNMPIISGASRGSRSNSAGCKSPNISENKNMKKNSSLNGRLSGQTHTSFTKSPNCKGSKRSAWISFQDFTLPRPFSHHTFQVRLAGNLSYADVLKKGIHVERDTGLQNGGLF
ncbi:cerebellar degeneration-related protein 2-like isoform X2 [Tachypleus tridentatus]|uniref:cerebellar degeneration-related protein 2-like isoform X2 n=1 Tax=Tachypleus tridentatus TaxID=6853 RepID=UPI003FD2251D